jgi:hypothetical protein
MTAGVAGEELDRILATHLLDPSLLRSADFTEFFADRRSRLLELIGQAMGRPVLDADGDAPSAFVDEPEEAIDSEVEINQAGPEDQPDLAALERGFHEAMVDVYRRARQEAGYQAGYFLQMVSEHGGWRQPGDSCTPPPHQKGSPRCGNAAGLI